LDTIDDLVTHRHLAVNDLRMHVVEAGTGPLVVLLHGFPDFWYSWRRQLPALVEAGYRVVAPDLRGYAGTPAPGSVRSYRLEQLVADVDGLVSALGEARASLVGHDWGGMVAWAAAGTHPGRFERLAVCNIPHPWAFRRALSTSRQLLHSWYAFAFQLPAAPERALRARDGWLLRRILRSGAARADSFTDADLDRYVDALVREGAFTGPLNYYRAAGRGALRRSSGSGADLRVEQPVLVQWGERDQALVPALADPPEHLVPDARVVRYPDAGHWVHLDEAAAVNDELLRFFAGRAGDG
jgi:epoxide hydrolase 4